MDASKKKNQAHRPDHEEGGLWVRDEGERAGQQETVSLCVGGPFHLGYIEFLHLEHGVHGSFCLFRIRVRE